MRLLANSHLRQALQELLDSLRDEVKREWVKAAATLKGGEPGVVERSQHMQIIQVKQAMIRRLQNIVRLVEVAPTQVCDTVSQIYTR